MPDSIVVALRDLTPKKPPIRQVPFLVEVEVIEPDEDQSRLGHVFEKFLAALHKRRPPRAKIVDIVISIDGQIDMAIPPRFMKLIIDTGWDVTIITND